MFPVEDSVSSFSADLELFFVESESISVVLEEPEAWPDCCDCDLAVAALAVSCVGTLFGAEYLSVKIMKPKTTSAAARTINPAPVTREFAIPNILDKCGYENGEDCYRGKPADEKYDERYEASAQCAVVGQLVAQQPFGRKPTEIDTHQQRA